MDCSVRARCSADSPSSSCTADRPRVLYAACLGQLGQFGNQLFQYAFASLYSDLHHLRLVTPAWTGAYAFVGARAKCVGSALAEGRLLLADRVVLSHAGWRDWASHREPLLSVRRASGIETLSGRRIRAELPQVNSDAI